MKYRRFTEAEKAEIWDRIGAGESARSVATAFGHYSSALSNMRRKTGGVRPRSRHPRESALTLGEREEISRGLAAERSCRAIAAGLRRAPSTISREVQRNGGVTRYRAHDAARRAWRRARRPKTAKLADRRQLREAVEAKLGDEVVSAADLQLVAGHLLG